MPKRTKSKGRSTKRSKSTSKPKQHFATYAKETLTATQPSNFWKHLRLLLIIGIFLATTLAGELSIRYRSILCPINRTDQISAQCHILNKESLQKVFRLISIVVGLNLCIILFGSIRIYNKWWNKIQKDTSKKNKKKSHFSEEFYEVLNRPEERRILNDNIKNGLFPIAMAVCLPDLLGGRFFDAWHTLFTTLYASPLFYVYLIFMAWIYNFLLFGFRILSNGVKDWKPFLSLLIPLFCTLYYLLLGIHPKYWMGISGIGPVLMLCVSSGRIFFKYIRPKQKEDMYTGNGSNWQSKSNYLYQRCNNPITQGCSLNHLFCPVACIGGFVCIDLPQHLHDFINLLFGWMLWGATIGRWFGFMAYFYPNKELQSQPNFKITITTKKIPFTYCAVVFYVLVQITTVNILFHLAASIVVNDHWFTCLQKILLLCATGWNTRPVLNLCLDLVMDSWYNSEKTSEILLNVCHQIHCWIDTNKCITLTKDDEQMARQESEISSLSFTSNGYTRSISPSFKNNDPDPGTKILKRRIRQTLKNVSDGVGGILFLVAFLLIGFAKLQNFNVDFKLTSQLGETTLEDLNALFQEYGDTDYFQKKRQKEDKTTSEYNICRHSWHRSRQWPRGISAFDYSILAGLSYIDKTNSTQIVEANIFLAKAFPTELYGKVHIVNDFSSKLLKSRVDITEFYSDDLKFKRLFDPDDNSTDIFDKFMTIEFTDAKLKVIAVQGTDPFAFSDNIADLRLWMESVMFEVATILTPTHKMLSPGLVTNLVELINFFQRFFVLETTDLDYYETVTRYAYKIRKENPGWKIAVTGHSLGGGIATIVGSTLGINAMAFSPPGLVRSRKHFDTELPDEDGIPEWKYPRLHLAAQHSINIVPMRDLITRADDHFGIVQNTLCFAQKPGECHCIEVAYRDLLNRCGDRGNGLRFVKDVDVSDFFEG